MKQRIEHDSLGQVKVPADKYFGAQTKRSQENFKIGSETIPIEIIHALASLKKGGAFANHALGRLSQEKKDLITRVCDEILSNKLNSHFPLVVWQTGSGTQSNMNINEVIANRANELAGKKLGSYLPIHPNDDVNMSQSSNDLFPSAIHIAALLLIKNKLLPNIKSFRDCLEEKEKSFADQVKVGRTHLMDAVPISLAQEFSGYRAQIDYAIKLLDNALKDLSQIPLGGTAVGTGINSHPDFSKIACTHLSTILQETISSCENFFAEISAKEKVVMTSSILRVIAVVFFKIANDIRLSGSGPRAGISELILPANEPGSSIMPGKVNPTQCEALTMVSIQIMGNDTAIGIAGSQGHFQLNAFMPLMAYNLIQSIHLLADSAVNFEKKCLKGLKPNKKNIDEHLNNSLMLATILNRTFGYEKTSKIVQKAFQEDISLKEAALALKLISAEEFDRIVDPKKMIHPSDIDRES